MSIDFDVWAMWGFDPKILPIIVPGVRTRRTRNGTLAIEKARFLGELGRDGLRSPPQQVALGALRLAKAGKLALVPEPLRSEIAKLLQRRGPRNGVAPLGAFDAGAALRGSLLQQASGALSAAAQAVQERLPEQAEKIAAMAPVPSDLPTATFVDTEKTPEQATAEVEALYGGKQPRVVSTAGEWRTESGKGEGIYDERFWDGDNAVAAKTRSPEQETAAKQAAEALDQASARGDLTAPQVEAIKGTLRETLRAGGQVTPELVGREVVKTQIGQGLTQATGGGAAPGPGGSLVGVGLGGPALGTGPVGGPVGQLLNQLFGAPQLPAGIAPNAAGLYATPYLTDPRWQHAAGLMDRLGTGYTQGILGLGPELAGVRSSIEGTFLDWQARDRAERQAREREFRREVLRLLWQIFDALGAGANVQKRY